MKIKTANGYVETPKHKEKREFIDQLKKDSAELKKLKKK